MTATPYFIPAPLPLSVPRPVQTGQYGEFRCTTCGALLFRITRYTFTDGLTRWLAEVKVRREIMVVEAVELLIRGNCYTCHVPWGFEGKADKPGIPRAP